MIAERNDRGFEPNPSPLIVIPVARQHGSHPFGSAPDRGNPGAGHLDQTERAHQIDELIDLATIACDLEHKTFGGSVDYPGAERVRQPQRLDPMLAVAVDL